MHHACYAHMCAHVCLWYTRTYTYVFMYTYTHYMLMKWTMHLVQFLRSNLHLWRLFRAATQLCPFCSRSPRVLFSYPSPFWSHWLMYSFWIVQMNVLWILYTSFCIDIYFYFFWVNKYISCVRYNICRCFLPICNLSFVLLTLSFQWWNFLILINPSL